EAADERAEVVELLRVCLLALVGPAVRDGEAETERRLVLGHEDRVADAAGARLDVDRRPRRQRLAQQLGQRRAVDVPGAARVERRERQAHRRSEEHTSELQSLAYLVCRLLLEKKKQYTQNYFLLSL